MRKRNYIRTDRTSRTVRRKRALLVLLVIGGLYLLWSLIAGEMGVVKYARMRAQERALRSEIVHLKQDNLRLMQEVRSLKHDPAYLERLARDTIGLVKPGEMVYYYGEPVKR